jgi:hypothetical protein
VVRASAENIDGGTADLEKLAAELDSKIYSVSLVTSAGRRPHLHITNRAATVLTENIYTAEGWFWWGWAERIAQVENLAAAAKDIARVLRVVDPGL